MATIGLKCLAFTGIVSARACVATDRMGSISGGKCSTMTKSDVTEMLGSTINENVFVCVCCGRVCSYVFVCVFVYARTHTVCTHTNNSVSRRRHFLSLYLSTHIHHELCITLLLVLGTGI
mmetsp:Transcript_28970/g.42554  ORF Transcript_28970/g.42554 Transcript_28970/m.42554 type:complete len:120 (-) Transcript_28970:137-496(-)